MAEIEKEKSDPEIYFNLAKELNEKSGERIVLEDSYSGMMAAKKNRNTGSRIYRQPKESTSKELEISQ